MRVLFAVGLERLMARRVESGFEHRTSFFTPPPSEPLFPHASLAWIINEHGVDVGNCPNGASAAPLAVGNFGREYPNTGGDIFERCVFGAGESFGYFSNQRFTRFVGVLTLRYRRNDSITRQLGRLATDEHPCRSMKIEYRYAASDLVTRVVPFCFDQNIRQLAEKLRLRRWSQAICGDERVDHWHDGVLSSVVPSSNHLALQTCLEVARLPLLVVYQPLR